MEYHISPLSYGEQDASPETDPNQEAIRIVVSDLDYTDGRAQLTFHATCFVPTSVASRYRDVLQALVLVVNDVDGRDGAAIRMVDEFMNFERGEGPNLLTPPPQPLPPRGETRSDSHQGGWVSGELSFVAGTPAHRPGVFLYMALENYVSNVVGLDLVERKTVEF